MSFFRLFYFWGLLLDQVNQLCGNKIKQARVKQDLLQRELADKVGVPVRTIGRIERGEVDVRLGTLKKVADALGIDWHVVADNDDAGKKYSESAEIYLGDSNKDDYISMLKKSNMDVLLCNAGYGEPYKEGLPSQTPPELRGSWDEVLEEMKRTFVDKPGQALKVARKLRNRALPIITAEENR